jgi:hypothetical protein
MENAIFAHSLDDTEPYNLSLINDVHLPEIETDLIEENKNFSNFWMENKNIKIVKNVEDFKMDRELLEAN